MGIYREKKIKVKPFNSRLIINFSISLLMWRNVYMLLRYDALTNCESIYLFDLSVKWHLADNNDRFDLVIVYGW